MNKQKLASSIIFLFSLFLLISCSNEPVDPAVATQLAAANAAASNGGGGTTGGGTLPPLNGNASLLIDGSTITANEITATKTIQPALGGDLISYSLGISSIDNSNPLNSKIITVQFGNTTGSNSYNLGLGNIGNMSYISDLTNPTTSTYTSTNLANPSSTTATGTVNVTSNDIVSRIFSGNYSGTIYLNDFVSGALLGTKTISNGVFTNVGEPLFNQANAWSEK